jgi:GTP-binding protein Era
VSTDPTSIAETAPATDPRCGFIALLGAPNAGKSTLVNRLVGAKVTIVSPKVQTTRSRVLGIAIRGQAQLILIDTPGIFTPRRRLERAMVRAAWRGAEDADVIVMLFDAQRRGIDEDSERIIAGLRKGGRKAILALNKIDLVKPDRLLALAHKLHDEGVFSDVFMISAETGDGVEDLAKTLAARVPAGPWHFPADQLSDLPERLLATEITREHLFRQLHQEIPYQIAVESEAWQDFKNGGVRIGQVIYVQRDNQRAIVLGKAGQRIKAVREAAQAELEAMLGRKVHLFLHVKLREGWPDDPGHYREIGLEYDV